MALQRNELSKFSKTQAVSLLTSAQEIFIMKPIKQERVNTMLFGKFCIDSGSTQLYQTEHCVEPDQIEQYI